MMKKLPLLLLVSLTLTPLARAEWTPRVELKGAEVLVNSVRILQARKPLGGVAPLQRARTTAERLAELTKAGLASGDITIDIDKDEIVRHIPRTVMVPTQIDVQVRVPVSRTVKVPVTRRTKARVKRGKRWRTVTKSQTVMVDKTIHSTVTKTVKKWVDRPVRKVFTVTDYVERQATLLGKGKIIAVASKDDAKAAKLTKPHELASSWREALQKALAIPGLEISAQKTLIPTDEGRKLTFRGAARGEVFYTLAQGNNSPVTIELDERKRTIQLRGIHPGKDTLTITEEGATDTVEITVQNYAGKLEKIRPLTVTGKSVSAALIQRHIAPHVAAHLHPEPGATVQIGQVVAPIQPMTAGRTQTVAVPVTIAGSDLITVSRTLNVPVVAKTLVSEGKETLLYSNNPERVEKYQTLYSARLPLGQSRVLFHHLNDLEEPFWFVGELVNTSDKPCAVQVQCTSQEPLRDPTYVGYKATSQFFSLVDNGTGVIVEIPARSRLAFVRDSVAPQLTVSGLAQLRVVSGSAPLLRIAATRIDDAQTPPSAWQAVALGESASVIATDSHHLYPNPNKIQSARYRVGGKFVFLSIGRVPIRGIGATELAGNYGVFYDMTVSIENPTGRTENVNLRFEPSGGLAGAVLSIDGKRVEIPRTNMPEETILATYKLAPGQHKEVRIRTMPLAGSNYPARIIIGP